jgi:hypothetical protein
VPAPAGKTQHQSTRRVAALTRCLDANTYQCHAQAAALVPILSDLEWAEQQVAEKCD